MQRVFWAFTEGAVATALLVAGGNDALGALQAASIVFGLPFNFILFGMMYCTVKMCAISEQFDLEGNHSQHLPEPDNHSWKMPVFGGVFNFVESFVSLGMVHKDRVNRGMHKPTPSQVSEFFIGLFLPPLSVYRILTHLQYSAIPKLLLTATYVVFFMTWIAMFGSSAINFGFVAFGFLAFFLNGILLAVLRMEVREKYALDGNLPCDFLISSFFYFQVLCQILYEFEVGIPVNPASELEGKGKDHKIFVEPEEEIRA